MALLMSKQTALTRLVEDDDAPVMARVRALQQIEHPELAVLRRLLVNSKTRQKPVPSKLKAVAALAYAQEMELRNIRKARKTSMDWPRHNALGI